MVGLSLSLPTIIIAFVLPSSLKKVREPIKQSFNGSYKGILPIGLDQSLHGPFKLLGIGISDILLHTTKYLYTIDIVSQ